MSDPNEKEVASFLLDPERYHDLGKHFTAAESYHDFEGFADAKAVLNKCISPKTGKYVWDMISRKDEPDFELIRSVFLGHIFERADTFGITDLTFDTIVDMYEFAVNIVTCRWWSRVTDDQIKAIETQSTDDDEEE